MFNAPSKSSLVAGQQDKDKPSIERKQANQLNTNDLKSQRQELPPRKVKLMGQRFNDRIAQVKAYTLKGDYITSIFLPYEILDSKDMMQKVVDEVFGEGGAGHGK